MKRIFSTIMLLLLCTFLAEARQPKYIFYFIGDGLGINHIYGTELYNAAVHPEMERGGKLSFTDFPIRSYVTNHSSSSLVTDSSAAATALASGVKTVNGYMGVDADVKPAKSLTELLSERGMYVGVATNVAVNHATPSAFFGHDKSRSSYGTLFEQLLASEVDFAAGSTILHKRSGYTPEGYIEKAKSEGWEFSNSPKSAKEVSGKRVLLLSPNLGEQALKYAVDCQMGDPTIVDYTDAALGYLEREAGKNGFLLMVEAGHIDYCAHDNDAVTTFEEVNHLSQSVQLALDFYAKHPKQTLIVITADHETGGLSLGYHDYVMHPENLAYQRCSMVALTAKMRAMRERGDLAWESMQALLSKELGLWDKVKLNEADEKLLKECFEQDFVRTAEEVVSLYNHNEKLASLAIDVLNRAAQIKWISLDHTGMQVPLYVKGAGEELFHNCYDNTDIPKAIARAMGLTLEN